MVLAVPDLFALPAGSRVTGTVWQANITDPINFLTSPPMFKGHQVAAQTIPNSTVTALAIDSADFDTYGAHSNTVNNSRFTAPVSGYWLVIVTASYAANATGNRLVEIHQNGGGTSILSQSVTPTPTTSNTGAVTASSIIFLNSGEYLEAFTYQTSGGNLATVATQTGMQVIWVHA